MSEIQSIVIVHFEEGDILPNYHVIGDGAVVFIVDDNCPNDRVFEITRRDPPKVFRQIIPEGSEIGHVGDARHAAIAHQIEALLDGKSPLQLVGDEQ